MSDKCSAPNGLQDAISCLATWRHGHFSFLYLGLGRFIHPFYIVVIAVVALVGFCRADIAAIGPQVPEGISISKPGPTSAGTSRPRDVVSMLAAVTCIVGLAVLHDFLTDWYKCSQPAATSQGERSEKIDKTVMDIYEHISRLGGRIVAIDDRLARWEKQMNKLGRLSLRSIRRLS